MRRTFSFLRLTFTSLNDVNAKGAVIAGNGTTAANISKFGKEDTVNVKITLGGATADVTAKGAVDYIDNVKVTKAYKPTKDGNGTDGSNLDKYDVSFSASTNTITIKEKVALDSITSASGQGKGKWGGILVDLDATLTDVSFSKDNSSYTVLDASEQAAAEAVGGTKANSLVYWINTDTAFDAQGNAKFYLKSSKSIKPLQVNVKFEKLN